MPTLADLARMFAQQRGAPNEMGPSLGLQNVNRGPTNLGAEPPGGAPGMLGQAQGGPPPPMQPGMMYAGSNQLPPPSRAGRDYIPGGNVGTGQWADAGTPSWNQAPSGGMGGPGGPTSMPPRQFLQGDQLGGGSSRDIAAQIGQRMGGIQAGGRADMMPAGGGPMGPMPQLPGGAGQREESFYGPQGGTAPDVNKPLDMGSSRDIASRIGRGAPPPGMGGRPGMGGGGGQQQMMQQLMQMLMRGRGGGMGGRNPILQQPAPGPSGDEINIAY